MIGIIIIDILTANAALTAVVSNRIYPSAIEQNAALPALVYKVETIPVYSKSGFEFDESKVTVLVVAKTYAQAVSTTVLLRSALDEKKGAFTQSTIKSNRITNIDENFDFENNTHIHIVEFNIKHVTNE